MSSKEIKEDVKNNNIIDSSGGGGGSNTPLNISTASNNNINNIGNGINKIDKSVTSNLEEEELDDSTSRLSDREMYLKNLVGSAEYTGPPKRSIYLEDDPSIFDENDPQLKEDIIRMIIQYLQDEGYTASLLTVQDEANVKFSEQHYRASQMKKMKKAILEGDWTEVEKLCAKSTFKNQQSFLYAVYRQAYLELLEKQEYQKAFTYLTKRLKPLEGRQSNADEFKDLCYLLTCKSVQEVASFKSWDGSKGASRERLVEQFQSMLDLESNKAGGLYRLPPHRLLSLLKQAVTYQIEFGRYHPKVVPRIRSLLEDYSCFVLPNSLRTTLSGHRKNVKCVEFIGTSGLALASGSSDNTIRLWATETGAPIATVSGNTARVWDLSSSSSGGQLASATGDGVVRIYDIATPSKPTCLSTIAAHEGDAYTVQFHPGASHIVTGGYDKSLHLYDVRTGQLVKSLTGHSSSVTRAIFNPHGNLVISGSKDSTIKFWDIVSGVCIKTLSSHLGEVTSVSTSTSGTYLLSASKDNSNRLWDIRTARPLKRFKGHQNTSKNFIRSAFGPNESLVISGSEDGSVYIWDIETCNVLQKLDGHQGMVYSVQWSQQQSILASSSHDNTVKLWWYDPSKPIYCE